VQTGGPQRPVRGGFQETEWPEGGRNLKALKDAGMRVGSETLLWSFKSQFQYVLLKQVPKQPDWRGGPAGLATLSLL
jgi:hypothetical protein